MSQYTEAAREHQRWHAEIGTPCTDCYGWISVEPLVRDIEAAERERLGPVDAGLLAEAMNDFERAAELSVVVHTNLGTHRADCAHVGWIVSAYTRLAEASDSPEKTT